MEQRPALISRLYEATQNTASLAVLHSQKIAQNVGLSAIEFEALDLLRREGALGQNQLAAACGITSGGVTGLVDRLERAGVARRVPDPNDRRRSLVEPLRDSEVWKRIDALYAPLQRAYSEVISSYTDEQLSILAESNERLNTAVKSVIDAIPDQ